MRKILLIALSLTAFITTTKAQDVGIKTNIAHWATASPNLGVEIGLGRQTTMDISAGFNPFSFSGGKQWKHWLVQPEFRWWTCERFNGHFLGAHLIGGGFNIGKLSSFPFSMWDGLENNRYKGHALGGGIAYGYAWMLGKHWNLEAEIGVGYAYSRYEKFQCIECGERLYDDDNHYFGLTKAAINLVYLF
jgi:hypothetical protein